MLSACASFEARPTPAPLRPETAPVIEQTVVTRLICPAELDAVISLRPSVPAGAVVEANALGSAWLSAELGWGSEILALFSDARSACVAERDRTAGVASQP